MVFVNAIVSKGNTAESGRFPDIIVWREEKNEQQFWTWPWRKWRLCKQFRPDREIYVVKKDGSKELFNVQKVISAVGKSAYRALTKFTKEEKEQICQYVVDKVNELEVDEVPIPIMHNMWKVP